MSKKSPKLKMEQDGKVRAEAAARGARPPSVSVFRAVYRYQGRRRRVAHWSFKLQFRGVRRTVRLAAAGREEAMREAARLRAEVLLHGWGVLSVGQGRGDEETGSGGVELSMSTAGYWRERLVFRRYTEALVPGGDRHYSLRLDQEGVGHYFPLGTDDLNAAALRAAELYSTFQKAGWERLVGTWRREFTVALFWSGNPVACTYTTLYTLPPTEASRPARVAGGDGGAGVCRVVVIEPDPGVRRALGYWIERHGFCSYAGGGATEAEVAKVLDRSDVVLVNHQVGAPGGGISWPAEVMPGRALVFPYGLYEYSDRIFASVYGVDRGYVLRRRAPDRFLEPLSARPPGTGVGAGFSREVVRESVARYFQQMLRFGEGADQTPVHVMLSAREEEILRYLSQGHLDKEVAQRLGISVWTVHSHLRKVFAKLNVHTRTEAVVKFLQR